MLKITVSETAVLERLILSDPLAIDWELNMKKGLSLRDAGQSNLCRRFRILEQ